MRTFTKTVFIGLVSGLTIGGIWSLQEQDYMLGTVVGLVTWFTGMVTFFRKGN